MSSVTSVISTMFPSPKFTMGSSCYEQKARSNGTFDIAVSVLGAKKSVHCNRVLVVSELAVSMLECGFSQHLAEIHGSTLGPANNE